MEEIATELLETIRWLPKYDRQIKWYRKYIDKVNEDLKQADE